MTTQKVPLILPHPGKAALIYQDDVKSASVDYSGDPPSIILMVNGLPEPIPFTWDNILALANARIFVPLLHKGFVLTEPRNIHEITRAEVVYGNAGEPYLQMFFIDKEREFFSVAYDFLNLFSQGVAVHYPVGKPLVAPGSKP